MVKNSSIIYGINIAEFIRIKSTDNVIFTSVKNVNNLNFVKKITILFNKYNELNLKMVIFYKNINKEILADNYENIIFIKYSHNYIDLVKYVPLFKFNIIKFNTAIITQYDYNIDYIESVYIPYIQSNFKKNLYNIPIAGNLLETSLLYNEYFDKINNWYRISDNRIIIHKSQRLPIDIINNFISTTIKCSKFIQLYNKINQEFNKGILEKIMLNVVIKYIEDNKIDFYYNICPYTYRSPFYYWLEKYNPDDIDKLKLLNILKFNNNYDTFEDLLLNGYNCSNQKLLYKKIQYINKDDLEIFKNDSQILDAFARFTKFLKNKKDTIYYKTWNMSELL